MALAFFRGLLQVAHILSDNLVYLATLSVTTYFEPGGDDAGVCTIHLGRLGLYCTDSYMHTGAQCICTFVVLMA